MIRTLLIFATLAAFVPGAAQAQPRDVLQPTAPAPDNRIALVIGNGTYRESPLKNPPNDARAMANALRAKGFKVILRENATKSQLEEAVADFGELLSEGSTGLFYYAGHGMQVQGRNYMIPVDARIASEQRVKLETVDMDVVLDQMHAARARVSLVVLDACRNNPFERRFRSTGGGLAQINAPEGTLIAYATAPGKVAADGEGDNGLYTSELLKVLNQPGIKVEDVFKQVRVAVSRASNGAQVPWESSSLVGDFFFTAAAPEPAAAPAPAPQQVAAVPAVPAAVDREAMFWDSIKDSRNGAMFQAYLDQFPSGTFAGLARARMMELTPSPSRSAEVPTQQAALPPAAAPATPAPPALDPIDRPMIVARQTNVREQPNARAKQVASLNDGMTVTVAGKVKGENWYLIERDGKPLGYAVSTSFETPESREQRLAAEKRRQEEAERQAAAARAAPPPAAVPAVPALAAVPQANFTGRWRFTVPAFRADLGNLNMQGGNGPNGFQGNGAFDAGARCRFEGSVKPDGALHEMFVHCGGVSGMGNSAIGTMLGPRMPVVGKLEADGGGSGTLTLLNGQKVPVSFAR